jgi:hypothetical protein
MLFIYGIYIHSLPTLFLVAFCPVIEGIGSRRLGGGFPFVCLFLPTMNGRLIYSVFVAIANGIFDRIERSSYKMCLTLATHSPQKDRESNPGRIGTRIISLYYYIIYLQTA